MSITNVANGQPRKQLSDQIDRLDGLLEGLSEGLNSAILDAVRDATRLALKDALVEILTDPDLRTKLQQAVAPQPAAKLGFWARLKNTLRRRVGDVGRMVSSTIAGAVHAVADKIQRTKRRCGAIAHAVRGLGILGSLRRLILVGAGVGGAIALVSFFAPHAAAVSFAGVGSGVAAMAVQVSFWLRRAFLTLSLT